MEDGNYTVRKIEAGKRKGEFKVLLENVPKRDCIWSKNPDIRVGSEVRVKNGKIVACNKS